MTEPPSGQQATIRFGGQTATIVEVGGGLRDYVVEGQPVLDGYALDEMASGGRGQVLLPWPNRLQDGQFEFQGQRLQLPIDEHATGCANHGLARWLTWRLEQTEDNRVSAHLILRPRPGYPFSLAVEVVYALGADGLTVRTRAENVGRSALPFGIGYHPYLTAGTPTVDTALLQVSAARYLPVDERLLPTGELADVAGSDRDFRQPRPIGALRLDTCYTDLERDADGRAWVQLSSNGRRVGVWMDAAHQFVQVFSGDTLVVERRRRGLAVEPMTCPANAFRSGQAVRVLEPGAAFSGAWGITLL